MADTRKKGFFDLSNLLRTYKRTVTLTEIVKVVCEQGWYNDLKKLGINTVIRQINNHNEKYGGTYMIEYEQH